MNKKIIFSIFFLLLLEIPTFSYELYGNFVQGGLIKGKVAPGTNVLLDNNPIKVSKNGLFVFGCSILRQSSKHYSWRYSDGNA